MLADEAIDLGDPRVDILDPSEGRLLLSGAPRALQLQGRELELMHMPLIGMTAAPKDGCERLDLLETFYSNAHDLGSSLHD